MSGKPDAAVISSDNGGDEGDKSIAASSKEVTKPAPGSVGDVPSKEQATVGDDPSSSPDKLKKSTKKKTTVKSSVQDESQPDLQIPAPLEESVPVAIVPVVESVVTQPTPIVQNKLEVATPEPVVPVARFSNELPVNTCTCKNHISRDELEDYKLTSDGLIQELQDRLSHEEDAASNLSQGKKKLEGDLSGLKKEIEDLELGLQKVRNKHFISPSCL